MKRFITLILFGLFLSLLSARGQVGLVPRSIDSDANANSADWLVMDQRGGLFVSEKYVRNTNEATPYTAGFWLRYVAENEELSGDVSGDGEAFTISNFSSDQITTYPESVVPTDGQWYYYFIEVDDSGTHRLYRNNILIQTNSNNASRFGSIAFGARVRDASATIKSETEFNFEVDDLTIWNGISQDIRDIHEEIWAFGSKTLNDGDYNDEADLLIHYNFENAANAPTYREDLRYGRGIPQIGIGYTTQAAAPTFNVDTGKPAQFVLVDIESDFGAERVFPKVSESGRFAFGVEQEFEAPQYVYLDRFRNELDPTTENIREKAFYRLVNVGYAIDGTDIQGTERFFRIEMNENIKVIWKWELEYALIVESATGDTDGLNDALGNPVPLVGKTWVPADTEVRPQIDGIIDPSSNVSIGNEFERFRSRGYVVENTPDQNNHCYHFTLGSDWLKGPSSGIDMTGDFTVEFWSKLDVSGATADQNVITFGSSTSGGSQLRVGFRNDNSGNRFFLANNSGGSDADASFTDEDWHHWAVVYDDTAKTVTSYRDGEVIATFSRDFIFNGNDTVSIGARSNNGGGQHYFPGSVDAVRVWTATRTETEIEASMLTQQYGDVADLALEVTFDSPSTTAVTTTDGSNLTFVPTNTSNLFPSGTSADEIQETLFPEFTFTQETNPPSRVGPAPIVIQDWLRVTWLWEKEYKYTLTVSDNAFRDLPFISGEVTLNNAGSIWVPEFSSITIGTKYRTSDRCFTWDGVQGPLYQLSGIAEDDFLDGTRDGVATRQFSVPLVLAPGEITFIYDKTVFRAEVPLGEGLLVLDTGNLNAQLIPDLCEGGELRTTAEAPPLVVNNPSQAGGTGDSIQWDPVGRTMWPLQPGIFRIEWPDANDPNETHIIEIVSGFPTETEQITWQRENDNGYREGSHPDYVTEVTMGAADHRFPASPTAHYRAVYSTDGQRSPRIELDPNEADRTGFVRQTFTNASIIVDDQANTLSATEDGQSVLLFNYAPGVGDVAVGDTSREAYMVRVVETKSLDDVVVDDGQLSSGDHGVLQFTGAANERLTVLPLIEGGNVSSGDMTIEFWAKLDPVALESGPDAAFITLPFRSNGDKIYVGVIGTNDPAKPNTPFVDFDFGATPATNISLDGGDMELNDGWHHWAIVSHTAGNRTELYIDGLLIDSLDNVTFNNFQTNKWDQMFVGEGDGKYPPVACQIDNFRVWRDGLETSEVREAMLTLTPSVTSDTLADFRFDEVTGTNVENEVPTSEYGTLSSADLIVTGQTDLPAEVATRVLTKYDNAQFGSGYVLNEVSNYNANIYDRSALNGEWGGIFPVNWSGLYDQAGFDALEVAYFENPYRIDSITGGSLTFGPHPNVAWPYLVVRYDDVSYPIVGEHKDKRIYISSRLGSEGVDENGDDQLVFDPSKYDELTIYNQPDPSAAGYNPNEEHALIAPSIKDQLTGDNAFNLSQNVAFALQNRLNVTDESSPSTYTSEPWVLVEYQDLEKDETLMAAYRVEETRAGSALFPALDGTTHQPLDSLGQPVAQPTDPTYDFEYPSFAGDVVIPLYPLNLVVGAVILSENSDIDSGGNFGIQRTLWNDKNGNSWVVSGEGSYFKRWWYPFRNDFWYDTNRDGANDINAGTPVALLPSNDVLVQGTSTPDPQIVRYNTYWRNDYPTLKRGETVTYPGGEYAAENTGAEGLPGIVAWASAQVIYDSAWPVMVFDDETGTGVDLLEKFSARVIRPLDRHEVDFEQTGFSDDYTPANTENIFVDGERWYFKSLVGSLQKRFYYDSLRGKLVFRGQLNNLEGGDPDLTQAPVALSILEPNVMTQAEYESIVALDSSNTTFTDAIAAIYQQTQDPHGTELAVDTNSQRFYAGVESRENATEVQPNFFTYSSGSDSVSETDVSGALGILGVEDKFQHLNSLGTGSALVPNPRFLTEDLNKDYYVTLVENNHPDVNGAVTLHIVRIAPERFRGAIKVVEAADAFDEKINLQHSGDFGANTEGLYYQWWVREVDNLDNVGLPGEDLGWQIFTQGRGLHSIEFKGRPDVVLSDKLFFVRYGEENELNDVTGITNSITDDPDTASADDASWRLVDFTGDTWVRSGSANTTNGVGGLVPFQWAGASNSPQPQADGSKKYIPQLVMGWVKRVLDRINPYEARYTDFYNNESPATYSSMLQIAGAPFNGKVALNASKDVVENVGLIQLYETVLARARELTLDIPGAATAGTNQALLLAATRLAFLYELFAREAYNDAQDSTISVTAENGLSNVAPYVHAFQNQEASLLHEELALLRGSDFVKAFPAYNRLFWNYVKGEGEAAYNANYNVYDENEDGFINEFDAARLYPQGHGDAWGHFLSSNKMHYELLRNNAFDWAARAELYSLLDNVIEADFLDEKSFARIAAAKARAGAEITRHTYRLAYTEDPDGQWQGYTDTDQARAWGVSEWSKRTGQAALFDWIIANAVVPEQAEDAENLDKIDRRANEAELGEITAAMVTIQTTLDEANNGFNPIGLDQDALVFDIDPLQYDGNGNQRRTHFEQIYEKAVKAAQNALATHDFAAQAENKIRRVADDTLSLQVEALKQDLHYKNRLIEIFGQPYDGTIGPGQIYAEGYDGPDTLLYLYLDRNEISDLVPDAPSRFTTVTTTKYENLEDRRNNLTFDVDYLFDASDDKVKDIFEDYYLTEDFADVSLSFDAPVRETSDYSFVAEDGWGRRTAYGRIQTILQEMLQAEISLEKSQENYTQHINRLELEGAYLADILQSQAVKQDARDRTFYIGAAAQLSSAIASTAQSWALWYSKRARLFGEIASEGFPKVVGFSNDVTSVGRVGVRIAAFAGETTADTAAGVAGALSQVFDAVNAGVQASLARQEGLVEEMLRIQGISKEVSVLVTQERHLRLEIAQNVQTLQRKSEELQSTLAEGFRVLAERESFNKILAAKAQRNRYTDMMFRLSRNESQRKYQDAFLNAQRYVWLAAKAYDFETSLSPGSPSAATTFLENIIKERTLGLWDNGEPRVGQAGLAEILAQLAANFDNLEGQLGINNPQLETERISLRAENFRIKSGSSSSDQRWQQALQARRVDDLWSLPEFTRYCRPFTSPENGAQPAIVLEFGTEITAGRNLFGRELGGGDHAYSESNFATKIRSLGVWFKDYNGANLATSPRVYFVPVGSDVLRLADSALPIERAWNVVEQRIPAPFVINNNNLEDPFFIPSINSLNGSFADLRRFSDFRAYHAGEGGATDPAQLVSDSRLIGRSVANTRWLLIVPGATLHADADYGLDQFVKSVSDIQIQFETYSHNGQ